MKRLLAFLLFPSLACAQVVVSGYTPYPIPNSATGTGANLLVKEVTVAGQSTATTVLAGDPLATPIEGICGVNCGTTGNAGVAKAGLILGYFDGPTTAGDAVVKSVTTDGYLHDAGAVTASYSIGHVQTSNAASGLYLVLMSAGGGGGGGTLPASAPTIASDATGTPYPGDVGNIILSASTAMSRSVTVAQANLAIAMLGGDSCINSTSMVTSSNNVCAYNFPTVVPAGQAHLCTVGGVNYDNQGDCAFYYATYLSMTNDAPYTLRGGTGKYFTAVGWTRTLSASGYTVSIVGDGPAATITRQQAFGISSTTGTSSGNGMVIGVAPGAAFSTPIIYTPGNASKSWSATDVGFSIDNSSGKAASCYEADDFIGLVNKDIRCSDLARNAQASVKYGNSTSSFGDASDAKVLNLEINTLSTNSATATAHQNWLTVNTSQTGATAGTISSLAINSSIAGQSPIATSDDILKFIGQNMVVLGGSPNTCTLSNFPTHIPIAVLGGLINFRVDANSSSGATGHVVGDRLTFGSQGSGTAVGVVSAVDSQGHITDFSVNSVSTGSPGVLGTGYGGTTWYNNSGDNTSPNYVMTTSGVGGPLTPTATSGTGILTGLLIDAQAYGTIDIATINATIAAQAPTSTGANNFNGQGCTDPNNIYVQVQRPALKPSSLNLDSLHDSHFITLQPEGDVYHAIVEISNHGNNEFIGLHPVGLGGAPIGVQDNYGGNRFYDLYSDTINEYQFYYNPNGSGNPDLIEGGVIFYNTTFTPVPGNSFIKVKTSTGNVYPLTVTNYQCQSGSAQNPTTGNPGFNMWVGSKGITTNSAIAGLSETSVMVCSTVPFAYENQLSNLNVLNGLNVITGDIMATAGNFDILPSGTASSGAPAKSSNLINVSSNFWNGTAAVNNPWYAYANSQSGGTDEFRIGANNGGLTNATVSQTSYQGFRTIDYLNSSAGGTRNATATQDFPNYYWCTEGRAWSTQSSPNPFCLSETIVGNATAGGRTDTENIGFTGGVFTSAQRFVSINENLLVPKATATGTPTTPRLLQIDTTNGRISATNIGQNTTGTTGTAICTGPSTQTPNAIPTNTGSGNCTFAQSVDYINPTNGVFSQPLPGVAVAAGTTITPNGPSTHVTGTATASLMSIASFTASTAGFVTLYADGVSSPAIGTTGFSWTTGGTATATALPFFTPGSGQVGKAYNFWQDGVYWYEVGSSTQQHLLGVGPVPTAAVNAGGGSSSGGTVAFDSNAHDIGGTINVTTGTSTTSSSNVVTLTWGLPYAAAPHCSLTPKSLSAANIASQIYYTTATTGMTIKDGTTALNVSTLYTWDYICTF